LLPGVQCDRLHHHMLRAACAVFWRSSITTVAGFFIGYRGSSKFASIINDPRIMQFALKY
jgi:hypothetical protein